MKVLFDTNQIKRINSKVSLERFCDAASVKNKESILKYLRSFYPSAASPQVLRDPLTNAKYADSEGLYTDGEYIWTNRITYLFDKYNIKLDSSFVRKFN